jgi:hypothetical protein
VAAEEQTAEAEEEQGVVVGPVVAAAAGDSTWRFSVLVEELLITPRAPLLLVPLWCVSDLGLWSQQSELPAP